MKRIKFLLSAFLVLNVIFMVLTLHSCGKDDNSQYDNAGMDNNGSNDEVAAAVRSQVSATYSTDNSRYFYIINIKSSLASTFPGKRITYGVDCGYGSYCHSKPESNSSSCSFLIPWAVCEAGSYTTGPKYKNLYIWNFTSNGEQGDEIGTLKNAGISNPSQALSDCITFMRGFYALQEKIDNGSTLTTAERQQYNDSKKYIEQAGITKMKSVLSIRVYCMVDGKKYTVGYIGYSGNAGGGNTGGGSTGGGNTGGGSTTYEKPDIGLADYTLRSTSITVKYRIYNQDEAKVTSAKVYYGTSSPNKSVTASVAGSLITANINGLTRNTVYYIKCTATGKGGSTTSETTRLMTTE